MRRRFYPPALESFHLQKIWWERWLKPDFRCVSSKQLRRCTEVFIMFRRNDFEWSLVILMLVVLGAESRSGRTSRSIIHKPLSRISVSSLVWIFAVGNKQVRLTSHYQVPRCWCFFRLLSDWSVLVFCAMRWWLCFHFFILKTFV
mgnify:CR=1 FL=1